MRTKKAFLNMITSLLLQLVTIICGFILPKVVLGAFGSDTNGLIASVSQFIGYITLLEAGVGGVTRAALYKPLLDNDFHRISAILKATESFFKKIAMCLIIYIVLLCLIYPNIIHTDKSNIYVIGIVLIVSISTFIQYYYGITYAVFLQADQKSYIGNVLGCITVFLNTVLSLILINLGFGIHVVKLGTAFAYIIKPLYMCYYVKKNYRIMPDCMPDFTAIKDRWNGFGQHLAFFFQSYTHIMVLSLFVNMKEISVYSIYCLIVKGVESFVTVISNGLEAGFGNIIACNDNVLLNKIFKVYEVLTSIVNLTLFLSLGMVISSFMKLYVGNIKDINYIRPELGVALILSSILYCFRVPYNSVTLAAGHYKQTQKAAFIEAGINVALSFLLVHFYGALGVVTATCIALIYRLFNFSHYLSKNILCCNYWDFSKRFIVNIGILLISLMVNIYIPRIEINDYYSFFLSGLLVTILNFIIASTMNYIFYRSECVELVNKIKCVLH